MSKPGASRPPGLKALGGALVGRIAGTRHVRALVAIVTGFNRAGGGLTANGLAFSALFALVPGLLLVLSVVGLAVDDPGVRGQVVSMIASAFPPLRDIAQTAFEQVSGGAVPGGIVAIVGLLWGSSRFYAALEEVITRIFHREQGERNVLQRGVRGIVLSALLVAAPVALLAVTSILGWFVGGLPAQLQPPAAVLALFSASSPAGLLLLFVTGVAVTYRFVPTEHVPLRALGAPALVAGTAIAVFTQLFAFVAPRLLGWTSLFGALVAVFAVLVWLSISLQVLMLGASWTRVRLAAEAAGPQEPGQP